MITFETPAMVKKVDLDLLKIDLILGIAGHRNLNFFNHGEEY